MGMNVWQRRFLKEVVLQHGKEDPENEEKLRKSLQSLYK
jgi:hypothetical protein